MIDESAILALMKRCQRGTQETSQANNLHADCYGALGALLDERRALRRGEFICSKCGLRKDGEKEVTIIDPSPFKGKHPILDWTKP